jgi:hypothetical protein
MARPLDLVVEEMLDYIEQAVSYVRGMTFEQLRRLGCALKRSSTMLEEVSNPSRCR